MGRWSQYDTDEERLPEGMTRIGYDADEQTYTFRDSDGSTWESAPGNQYGRLTRVSAPQRSGAAQQSTRSAQSPRSPSRHTSQRVIEEEQPLAPPPPYVSAAPRNVSWRHEMMPLFNFLLLIGLFLIGVFFYLRGVAKGKDEAPTPIVRCGPNTEIYVIERGDTCWDIAGRTAAGLARLVDANDDLVCENLSPGQKICVPTT